MFLVEIDNSTNQSGTKQGSTLATALFLIYINGNFNKNDVSIGVKFKCNKT